MDSEFEVTGLEAGTVTMSLLDLADAMERFYFDEMKPGDSLIIKRLT